MAHATIDEIEEKCILVAVIHGDIDERLAHEYLDELAFLAETAGAKADFAFTQKLPYPNPRTYVGEGKLQEVEKENEEHERKRPEQKKARTIGMNLNVTNRR